MYRNTSSTTVTETGNLLLTYNEANTVGSKWQLSRDFVGNANVSITITDAGQIQITTTALSGTGYNGFISFSGRALQTTY